MMLHASLSIQIYNNKEKRKEKTRAQPATGPQEASGKKRTSAQLPLLLGGPGANDSPAGTAADGDVGPERSTHRLATGHPEAGAQPSPPAAHSSVDRSFALRTACLTSGSAVVSGVVLEWVGHRHRHGTRRTSGRPACGVTSPHRLTVELPAFAIPRVRHHQPESQSQVGVGA